MKKATWRKQHKWLGIGMTFFMLMFCVSGILLNHRSLIKEVNVSRKYLPGRYEYRKWNGGLLRGTLDLNKQQSDTTSVKDEKHRLLLYGNGGIWLTDSRATCFNDCNEGLPQGADYRQIRNIIKTDCDNIVFAVSPFGLYRYGENGCWQKVKMPLGDDEKLTDIASHGDSLVVLSRDYAYLSMPPYRDFRRIQLQKPKDYDGRVTAFRTIWMLHSGELFCMTGKIIVDGIAVCLVLLCITGFIFWLKPKRKGLMKSSLQWHDKIGRYTIIFTLLTAFTGWCLRPPVMIALVMNKMPAIPLTTLKSDNAWHDKLRMIRHDNAYGDWLLSTSEGFYAVDLGSGKTDALTNTPPVSVMGLNAWEQDKDGKWYCGSFSGLFVWDRQHSAAIDYFTGKPAPKKSGAPFGKKAIAGMSLDFNTPVIAEYYDGTDFASQPADMNQLPMSLWNVALEIHSGRIFIGSAATYIFIFVMGILALWCLWSGYKIRLKKNRKKTLAHIKDGTADKLAHE